MEILRRRISYTQSAFSITKNEGNQQGSYNLDLTTMEYFINNRVIVETNSYDGTTNYKLSDDYTLELGDGIKALIGASAHLQNLSVNFAYTIANDRTKKFQIKRTDNITENSWFSRLYDRNIKDSEFVVDIDVNEKKLCFENVLPIILHNNEEIRTFNQLLEVLKDYKNRFGSICSIRFGFDFYDEPILNGNNINQLLINAGIPETYVTEVNKGKRLRRSIEDLEAEVIDDNNGLNILEEQNQEISHIGTNRLFYGIPGSGKSFFVENVVLRNVDNKDVFRTTFYSEYSYSDFVGQIYPTVEGEKVTYKYLPGPFTKALVHALLNPSRMVYLVIEELNRGNAPAIFGDIFQLLDRVKIQRDNLILGESEFPISNHFIENYINEQNIIRKQNNLPTISVEENKVKIPNNLTILATMNTSDQNVFTLDTAFKRRWDRERFNPVWDTEIETFDMYVPFTDITWRKFALRVNSKIVSNNSDVHISKDKQLGPFFATKEMLCNEENRHVSTPENIERLRKFANNVVDYLFEDVTRFDHQILFNDNNIQESLSEIIQSANLEGADSLIIWFSRVFIDEISGNVE